MLVSRYPVIEMTRDLGPCLLQRIGNRGRLGVTLQMVQGQRATPSDVLAGILGQVTINQI